MNKEFKERMTKMLDKVPIDSRMNDDFLSWLIKGQLIYSNKSDEDIIRVCSAQDPSKIKRILEEVKIDMVEETLDDRTPRRNRGYEPFLPKLRRRWRFREV